MPKKEFRIIASNGENFYEFFYIIQSPAGDFYYGNVGPDSSRTSVHVSGVINQHWKNQETIRFPAKEKLNELKGLYQLCGMYIGSLVFENSQFSKPPRKGKVDGLVYFDIRKFKSAIGIMIFLLEPHSYASLSVLHKLIDKPHFYIITETTPWLIIALHETNKES